MTIFVSDKNEARNEKLFDTLVSCMGNCETIEGEVLRAINRLVYRYYNDGDYWWEGYGCETAGPAAAFLKRIKNRTDLCLNKEINASDQRRGEAYEKQILAIHEKILDWIESKNGEYTLNIDDLDMDETDPIYENNGYYDDGIDF